MGAEALSADAAGEPPKRVAGDVSLRFDGAEQEFRSLSSVQFNRTARHEAVLLLGPFFYFGGKSPARMRSGGKKPLCVYWVSDGGANAMVFAETFRSGPYRTFRRYFVCVFTPSVCKTTPDFLPSQVACACVNDATRVVPTASGCSNG